MEMREIKQLMRIMARLRGPKGCPWDRQQTHRTLRPMILEEVYELLEAIDQRDDHALREELGDVLLHIIFHAQLARERRAFDLQEVAKELAKKLVQRHPHVFGRERLKNPAQVLQRWHQLKQQEKPSRRSSLDGVPRHLPALLRAQNLQKRAARVGFEWPDPSRGIPAKVREELRELGRTRSRGPAFSRELGDLLFTLVNLARHRQVDAESACRDASERFARRVRSIETHLAKKGLKTTDLTPLQLDREWKKAKNRIGRR
ncbi:MAG: nucleoside triphosphate pyrophosphohydrolase [Verrucomicrobia bacterium]|nr:nucleoside triphosphate pyrophosphohydrolase [Verrucomicrobiota bacterium]